MSKADFTVRRAHWRSDQAALKAVRTAVFIDEQHVPKPLEWDGLDANAVHALAFDSRGEALGTGRLLPTGQIGRMAVLARGRGSGVGGAVLQMLINEARAQGLHECFLHAQTHALGFYGRYGFTAEGEEFDDANIPHLTMRLVLPQASKVRTLTTHADNQTAAVKLVRRARREVAIYSRDLDAPVYDTSEFLAAMRDLTLATRSARIRILVIDTDRATKQGHRLVELARRLSSFFEIRRPVDEHDKLAEAFLIVDGQGLIYRPLAVRYEGFAAFDDSVQAREKLRQFNAIWERAEPEPEFRRLAL